MNSGNPEVQQHSGNEERNWRDAETKKWEVVWERERERGEGAEWGWASSGSMTRLVVLMFSLADPQFGLHSLMGGFMRNWRSSGSESKTSIQKGGREKEGGEERKGDGRDYTEETHKTQLDFTWQVLNRVFTSCRKSVQRNLTLMWCCVHVIKPQLNQMWDWKEKSLCLETDQNRLKPETSGVQEAWTRREAEKTVWGKAGAHRTEHDSAQSVYF